MGQSMLRATAQLDAGAGEAAFLQDKCTTARFYFGHFLPRAGACLAAIEAGSSDIMALDAEAF
jgi:hypothetical protein